MKENFTIITNIPKMLGIKETADEFGISQNYARQLALSGTVKAVRVGREKNLFPTKKYFLPLFSRLGKRLYLGRFWLFSLFSHVCGLLESQRISMNFL